ncbi:hypothetical protein GCM10010082_10090 [Kushneria pakistanensis]|uniref:DNA recombination protein RmuC n=1 Tax=Kushneria pakistanensis TaxID=1508770 RepID=A0ABQ3FE94_9GAMM|nr:hypothetical protein [Kushneria pakistanensis]GHC20219.1 hypothetical protein GCM10010082_10090 [Kushneria pakistanensis]
MLLLLTAAIVVMGVQYYQDRQHWAEQMAALTDRTQQQMSERQEMSVNLDQVLKGLRDEQQMQRTQLERLQHHVEQQANDNEQQARLNQLVKNDALRQQTLVSLQQSQDSLETVIEGLKGTYDARFEDVDNTNAEQSSQLQKIEGIGKHLETLDDRLADQERSLISISEQVDELVTQNKRLQQSQTSLRAAQESLQDILNP